MPLPTGATLPLASLAPAQALLIGGAASAYHVLSSTEFGYGYACVVTEAGPIFCWPHLQYLHRVDASAASFFVPVPPGSNATRFVSVQIAGFSVVGLLDTGGLVASLCSGGGGSGGADACAPASPLRIVALDPGPYAEVSSYPGQSCAIRADGEIECWQWAFPGGDPAQLPLLASGLRNLTAAKQPSRLCSVSSARCVSSGGPFRSLAFEGFSYGSSGGGELVCALRAADGKPFCAGMCTAPWCGANGGAAGVGRATTNAVVSAFILILLANLIITVIVFGS